MKLSPLKCLFSFNPQSTVNVPVVASCCAFGVLTFGLTVVMSTNSDLSAPSARASPWSPVVVNATARPTVSANPVIPAVSFARREKECRPWERVM